VRGSDADVIIRANSVGITVSAIGSARVLTSHGRMEASVGTVDCGIDLCALSMDVSASSSVTDGGIWTERGRQRGQLVEAILEAGILLEGRVDGANTHNQIAGVGNGGNSLIEES